MTDNSFSIGGKNFKLSKMDAFKQFHVVRRVGPILAQVMESVGKPAKSVDKMSDEEKLSAMAKFIGPVFEGLSKLSDQEAEKVLHMLLSCAEMESPGMGWAKISTGEILMVQNLELPVLLQVAGRAFMYNLSGFFSALPQK